VSLLHQGVSAYLNGERLLDVNRVQFDPITYVEASIRGLPAERTLLPAPRRIGAGFFERDQLRRRGGAEAGLGGRC
jgi:hypothetical protein